MRHVRRKENHLMALAESPLSSNINVTPFVDVCLVLLIIFMVVTPMLQRGVPVVLPQTTEPEKTPDTEKQLQISVKDDGLVFIGPNARRMEELTGELEDIFEVSPDREIAVKGDKRAKYGVVLEVLRACRDAGFENVGLISEQIKDQNKDKEG